ncbi:MAG: hypothetical protein R3F11_21220 [Verrucomicrobiales bacterium]
MESNAESASQSPPPIDAASPKPTAEERIAELERRVEHLERQMESIAKMEGAISHLFGGGN